MLHAPYCSVTTPRSHYIPKSFQFLCCRRFFCFLSHSEQRIPFCHFQSFHVHTVLFLTFGGLTYTQLVRNRGTCKRELSRSWENTEDCEGGAADDDDDDDDDDDASNASDDNDDDDDDDAAGDAEGREELAKESSLALVGKY